MADGRMKPWRFAILIIVVVLVAAGAYAGYWFVAANSLQAGLEKWAAARRAQGYTLQWGRESVDGFPLRFRIALDDASIARGNSYHIAVPEIAGEASPWDVMRWHVTAPRGGTGTAQGMAADIVAKSLSGDVTLGGDATDIDVSILELTGAGATAGQLTAHITLPRQAPRSDRDLALAAMVRLYHLVLPKPVTALGDTIENVTADFKIMGGLPQGDWRQALAAWRDAGGNVEIDQANLQWGALHLEANGTLALDRDMQPIAALSASIVDHAALIDAAVAAGILPKKNSTLVKLVLNLLAKRDPDGQTRLTAPVTVQNGRLTIGRVEIGKLPPIDWR
jgi:hypothetical protein